MKAREQTASKSPRRLSYPQRMTRLVPREQVVEALEAQMRDTSHFYGVDLVTQFKEITGRPPESSSFFDNLEHWFKKTTDRAPESSSFDNLELWFNTFKADRLPSPPRVLSDYMSDDVWASDEVSPEQSLA